VSSANLSVYVQTVGLFNNAVFTAYVRQDETVTGK